MNGSGVIWKGVNGSDVIGSRVMDFHVDDNRPRGMAAFMRRSIGPVCRNSHACYVGGGIKRAAGFVFCDRSSWCAVREALSCWQSTGTFGMSVRDIV